MRSFRGSKLRATHLLRAAQAEEPVFRKERVHDSSQNGEFRRRLGVDVVKIVNGQGCHVELSLREREAGRHLKD